MTSRSPVGRSLLRLNHAQQTAQNPQVLDIEAWRESWSDRRDQIAQRLAQIDVQLEHWASQNTSRPSLSLVTSETEDAARQTLEPAAALS